MIPNKLLLRAVTVMALTRGGVGPFPTMAGGQVFDSKLSSITDLAQESMTPVVLVYTDADQRKNRDTNTKNTFRREVMLVIEIAITSGTQEKGGLEYIETDAELEALMDLFEVEVEAALRDLTSPWAAQWREMIKAIDSWEIVPYRSAEQTKRLAVRQIAIACELNTDCLPKPSVQPPAPVKTHENGEFIPGSILPVPYLAGLETDIATHEAFESTRALLTDAASQTVVPMLRGVFLKADFVDPADPNRLPPGQTKGPDGRIEVEAHIEGLDQ